MDLDDSAPTFANRVREARQAKNWSMSELARAAGITRQNVGLIERGQWPKDRTITALADALGVDRAWLFFVIPSSRCGGRSIADTQKAS